jgi:hypothetical protein
MKLQFILRLIFIFILSNYTNSEPSRHHSSDKCLKNYYSEIFSSDCKPCPDDAICKKSIHNCRPGYYLDVKKQICTKCAKGSYSIDYFSKSCTSCYESSKCPDISLADQKGIDISTIISLAKISEEAYDNDNTDVTLQDYKVVENENEATKAIIGYEPSSKTVIIVFRGTAESENIENDLNISKEYLSIVPECEDCKVHEGFLISFDSLSEKIIETTKNLRNKYPDSEVIVTGHSLGGGMANIAAVLLEHLGMKVSLYTFGSPRVGNDKFVDYANKRLMKNIRVTYAEDPVTALPPRLFGYEHSGTEVHFYDNIKYFVLPKFWDRSQNLKGLNLDDHSGYKNISLNKRIKL